MMIFIWPWNSFLIFLWRLKLFFSRYSHFFVSAMLRTRNCRFMPLRHIFTPKCSKLTKNLEKNLYLNTNIAPWINDIKNDVISNGMLIKNYFCTKFCNVFYHFFSIYATQKVTLHTKPYTYKWRTLECFGPKKDAIYRFVYEKS